MMMQQMMKQQMKMRMEGAPAGGVHGTAVFVKGEVTRFPASIPDGTSNTILIIEAGNPVPWTKPEDLHYADDEPLPELGGLFPNVIHAAFADGAVHTLTKNYDEKQLRYAITANGGEIFDLPKIQDRSPRRAGTGGDRASVEAWQQRNEELRKELEQIRRQIRLLKEEQEVEREMAGEDPQITQLKEENALMQAELKKLRDQIESLKKGIRQPRNPTKRIEEEEEQSRIRQPRKPRVEDEGAQGFIDRLWPNFDVTRLEKTFPRPRMPSKSARKPAIAFPFRSCSRGPKDTRSGCPRRSPNCNQI